MEWKQENERQARDAKRKAKKNWEIAYVKNIRNGEKRREIKNKEKIAEEYVNIYISLKTSGSVSSAGEHQNC